MDFVADNTFSIQERPPMVEDQLSRLRKEHTRWAFVYDSKAGLFHAVRGRRHYVATCPTGPWHRTRDVRL